MSLTMSTLLYSPDRIQSLLESFVELSNSMRNVAQELRDGLAELHTQAVHVDEIDSNASGTSKDSEALRAQSGVQGIHSTGDNGGSTMTSCLSTPLAGPNTNSSTPTRYDRLEVTPHLVTFLESMAMLPPQMSENALEGYLMSMKVLIGNLPQETFAQNTTHRDTEEDCNITDTMPSAAFSAEAPVICENKSRSVPVFQSQEQTLAIREPVEQAPVKALWTSIQPVITQTAFGRLMVHGDPKAAFLVHLLKTKMPSPKALIVYHKGFDMTVIRDRNDKYAVLPGPTSMGIEKGVMKGTLTVEKMVEKGLLMSPVLMDVAMIDGLEIEYQEGGNTMGEETLEPVAGPSGRGQDAVEKNCSAFSTAPVGEGLSLGTPSQHSEVVTPNDTHGHGSVEVLPTCNTTPHIPSSARNSPFSNDFPTIPLNTSQSAIFPSPVTITHTESINQALVSTTTQPDDEIQKKATGVLPSAVKTGESRNTKTRSKRGREDTEEEEGTSRELPIRVKRRKWAASATSAVNASTVTTSAAGPSQTSISIPQTPQELPVALRRSRRLLQAAATPVETLPPNSQQAKRPRSSRSKGK